MQTGSHYGHTRLTCLTEVVAPPLSVAGEANNEPKQRLDRLLFLRCVM